MTFIAAGLLLRCRPSGAHMAQRQRDDDDAYETTETWFTSSCG